MCIDLHLRKGIVITLIGLWLLASLRGPWIKFAIRSCSRMLFLTSSNRTILNAVWILTFPHTLKFGRNSLQRNTYFDSYSVFTRTKMTEGPKHIFDTSEKTTRSMNRSTYLCWKWLITNPYGRAPKLTHTFN